ncbi:MiaB family protein, possibly involved in tRNA or rRNA modification [Rubellimicrobium mesophilum DSM 19309]|uniref:MiaB family protein, possibly involved in tRNA or rRNA modification n=1 Tax=Rubellimicrobium mesophilum DSM 19309 TaxID=442562 RepID=A0A017HLE0_9RHOB|nr:MiaB family protein, possibly involved in tRNA or rRNA modification [Rubellimicrobium mesophilum DSM 19309]
MDDCGLTWLHVFPFSPRKGTPAAKMPQVAGPLIRERAARLRAAGEEATRRHLDAQVGRRHLVLMESATLGRTEQFAEVLFGTGQPLGALVEAEIAGRDGERLRAA